MTVDRQSIKGSNNTQIIGNNNLFNPTILAPTPPLLTHSFIHELLDVVYSLPSSRDDTYALQQPAQMRVKMKFNHAVRYMAIVENHVDDYVRLDEVMKDYPNSEHIVKKLRDMFITVEARDEDGYPIVGDGDAQLDCIKHELFNLIINDSKFDAEIYPREIIEQFCIALIAYGISKCKILETPV